jgi:FMN-dependent NADH-azoreductase
MWCCRTSHTVSSRDLLATRGPWLKLQASQGSSDYRKNLATMTAGEKAAFINTVVVSIVAAACWLLSLPMSAFSWPSRP